MSESVGDGFGFWRYRILLLLSLEVYFRIGISLNWTLSLDRTQTGLESETELDSLTEEPVVSLKHQFQLKARYMAKLNSSLLQIELAVLLLFDPSLMPVKDSEHNMM